MTSDGTQDECREVGSPRPGPRTCRFDLICGPGIEETCEEQIRRWARDRALPAPAVDRLWLATSFAVRHGLLFGPRGVSLVLGWVDVDRVRVVVQWHGCTEMASNGLGTEQLDATVALLDELTEAWGFGQGSTGSQWLVVDAGG